jgi:hypothetical protein
MRNKDVVLFSLLTSFIIGIFFCFFHELYIEKSILLMFFIVNISISMIFTFYSCRRGLIPRPSGRSKGIKPLSATTSGVQHTSSLQGEVVDSMKNYEKNNPINDGIHRIVIIFMLLYIFFNFSFLCIFLLDQSFFDAISYWIVVLNIPTTIIFYFTLIILASFNINIQGNITMLMAAFFTVLPGILIISLIVNNKFEYINYSKKKILLLYYLKSLNHLIVLISFVNIS